MVESFIFYFDETMLQKKKITLIVVAKYPVHAQNKCNIFALHSAVRIRNGKTTKATSQRPHQGFRRRRHTRLFLPYPKRTDQLIVHARFVSGKKNSWREGKYKSREKNNKELQLAPKTSFYQNFSFKEITDGRYIRA